MKNILNRKAIKNAIYTVLGTVKKALTQNRCDNCGFTKDEVYVTEHFTEGGFIECMKCYNNRPNY
tara:strand:- start:54 stop:248 length:195 start_codon:yes stop_codon:yes gene_type:complete